MTEVAWSALDAAFSARPSAVTVGVFDGLHAGHLRLIEAIGVPDVLPVVVTFERHPSELLSHDSVPGFLTSGRQKRVILTSLGVGVGVFVEFNEAFRSLPGRRFLDALAEHFDLRRLVVGHDFRCGYRLDTDIHAIRDHFAGSPVEVVEIGPVERAGSVVSSTRIRELIAGGRILEANELLGRRFALDLHDEKIEHDGKHAYVVLPQRRMLPEARQIVPTAGRYGVDLHCESSDGTPIERSAELEIGENSLSWPLARGESIRYIVMNERRI